MERDALPLLPQTHVSAPMTMTASRCWALVVVHFIFYDPYQQPGKGISTAVFSDGRTEAPREEATCPQNPGFIGLELTQEPVTKPCPRRVGDCRGQREGSQGAWPTQK